MSPVYEIGPFRLDPGTGVLTRAGQPLALGARAVAVLAVLVGRPNEYVHKDIILESAWPGVVVEESNLAVQISAIRRALAAVPGAERWVETLPRRGYRFIGPVTEVRDNQPYAATGERHNSNLGEPLTSFVGRERELVEIKRLLPCTRLLTITGVGGIGKTRLAIQAAVEVIAAYRDGVWLVDLGPLSDPMLVPSAVAQVLGLREIAARPLVETMCSQLKGRQLLLLLDNCEHLLEASAQLTGAVLRSAADLTVVATSREALHVPGEQIYALAALSLPPPAANPETAARSEAVQLFFERARKQQPDFTLTAARAPVVAELCIRLDGIPLALELAAARVRALSIEQIGARINDCFKLLTGGANSAPLRQQTLRATIDWSHDLLGERERAVFRRLAIFASGFTLEAAASVVSDVTIDEFTVIELLSHLVSRSLVNADTQVADTRYRLLETMRAYAQEKLDEAGETELVQRRHARYFRARFEHAPDDVLTMSDADWRAIYPPELDNVRTALDWAFGSGGDPATGVALTGASFTIWVELSLYDEGVRRIETALALVSADTPAIDQARLWEGLGTLWSGRAYEHAATAFRRAAQLFRQLDHSSGLGTVLVQMGLMLAHLDRLELAVCACDEALPALERASAPRAWGHYFGAVGDVKRRIGEPAAARENLERALTLYRSVGAERDALSILTNLADLTWTGGDLDAALAATQEAVAQLQKVPRGRKTTVGICLSNLAGVYVERGELGAALVTAREGLPLLQEVGMVWSVLDHLALRAALAGALANAARLAGFADGAHRAKKTARGNNEARARTRLDALLREKIAADELERLFAEGGAMNQDAVCLLALEQ